MSSHILSEVEQVADRIGVADGGRLIEELASGELRARARVGLEIDVSSPERAAALLAVLFKRIDRAS